MTISENDLANSSLTETMQPMQTTLDQFNAFITAPPRKLDADEYMANDLDGSTEGILGSGNLNFLMLQAGQTDESIENSDPFGVNADQIISNAIAAVAANAISPMASSENQFDTAMDRPFSISGDHNGGLHGGPGGGQPNGSAGSIGASSYVASSHAGMPFGDVTNYATSSAINTSDIRPAIHGTNGTGGVSGTNGTNGTNGVDGTPGGNTTVINNEAPTNIFDTVNNLTENVFDTTTNIFDTVNHATTNIFDTLNNIFDNITGGDLGPVGISLDAALDDLSNLKLDIISGDNILNVLDETLDASPILTPVEGLLGNLLSSVSLDAILNPFQYDSSPNDYDLHLGTDVQFLGITAPPIALDIPLDPVEGLLGDIDIGLNLTDDLLNLGGILGGGNDNGDHDLALGSIGPVDLATINGLVSDVINPVENLIGDVDVTGGLGLGLLGADLDNGGADTDIHIPLDIDLVDSELLSNGLNISLAPVETITGDIDLDLTAAANILGNVADNLVDDLNGGTGEDNILSQAEDTASGIMGDLLSFGGGDADQDISFNAVQDTLGFDLLGNATDITLDPVESITGDIDLVGSLDLLHQGDFNAATDTDLPIDIGFADDVIPAVHLDNIPLDGVESIVGDIDLNLNANEDLANGLTDTATHLLDTLGNATEDLSSLLGNADTGSSLPDIPDILAGDSTGTISDLLGGVNDVVNGAIDLLESVSGNSAGGLDLGGVLSGGDTTSGLDSVTSWTETALPDVGGVLGSGLESTISSILPDPVSTSPVAVLPSIPVIPVVPPLTGIFGGGHHGGLFG